MNKQNYYATSIIGVPAGLIFAFCDVLGWGAIFYKPIK